MLLHADHIHYVQDSSGLVCVIMMVADALVPNRHQVISNHHADFMLTDLIFISNQTYDFTAINLSPPTTTYMREWIKSALVQIMACRLFGSAGLLSIGPLGTNFSEILIKIQNF